MMNVTKTPLPAIKHMPPKHYKPEEDQGSGMWSGHQGQDSGMAAKIGSMFTLEDDVQSDCGSENNSPNEMMGVIETPSLFKNEKLTVHVNSTKHK